MDRRQLLASLASSGIWARASNAGDLLKDQDRGIGRVPSASQNQPGDRCGTDGETIEEEKNDSANAPAFLSQKVDTNVTLFRWPFRRLPLDQTERLRAKLKSLGVARAWAGTFEGVFQRDMTKVNDRLARHCFKVPFFSAIGSINLSLPNWRKDLQRCIEKHGMQGVRLHPNYHGYPLKGIAFEELIKVAGTAKVFVQIAVALEDSRTQNRMVAVPDTALTHLKAVASRYPNTRIQLLNLRGLTGSLADLRSCENLFLDTARIDGTDGVSQILQQFPSNRILYGSHSPFLIPEASMIRMHESGISLDVQRAIFKTNACRFVANHVA